MAPVIDRSACQRSICAVWGEAQGGLKINSAANFELGGGLKLSVKLRTTLKQEGISSEHYPK
jgi:hypothetical protein